MENKRINFYNRRSKTFSKNSVEDNSVEFLNHKRDKNFNKRKANFSDSDRRVLEKIPEFKNRRILDGVRGEKGSVSFDKRLIV